MHRWNEMRMQFDIKDKEREIEDSGVERKNC